MQRFLKLTTLILCLEMIIGPVAPALQIIPLSYAEDCPSGTQFDSTLNRCITTEQMASIMNATSNCSPSDKECYKANAERALKEGEEEGKIKEQLANKGGLMGSGMKVAAVAVPMFMAMSHLFKSKATRCPGSPSVYIMLGAGASIFLADLFANLKHKKRLKKIKEEWEGIRKGEESGDKGSGDNENNVTTASLATTDSDPDVRNAQAKESQAEAFEMLAKSEDSLASAAKFKSTFYAIGALAFAGASVMSFLEASKPDAVYCQLETTTHFNPGMHHFYKNIAKNDLASVLTLANSKNEYQSPTLSDYSSMQERLSLFSSDEQKQLLLSLRAYALIVANNLLPIPTANAQTPVPISVIDPGPLTIAPVDISQLMADLPPLPQFQKKSFLERPIPRGIISGVFAAWAGLMFMHAKKQAKISKARAQYLRDRKDEFNDATGAISCTSNDRNNVNNLKCYCYTSSGQRNSQRANSQACIALFTGRNISGENNYLNGSGIANQKVCMTNSGVDENCACRTNNSCLSAVPTNFSGINPGSLGLISSSTSPLNQLTSGQIAAASVNGDASVGNALKLLDQAKKMQKKIPALAGAKGDKLARDMAGSLIASSAGASAPQLSSPSSGNPFSLSPSQAAASLEKELKDADTGIAAVKGGGYVPQPGGAGKADDFGLEFGMTQTQLAADQTKLSDMNKGLDFGQNDINNSSDTNLFEVLSNRYQRSGMRRLFDESGKLPADPAAKTDITE